MVLKPGMQLPDQRGTVAVSSVVDFQPADSLQPTSQETASGLFGATSNPRSLSRKLENIKMHKDGIFGAVNNIELRHNSVVFYRIHRKHHRNTERELYNKADHQVNRQLQHGGHPSYFHFEGFDNRSKNLLLAAIPTS